MVEHVNTIGRRSVFSCLWSPTKSPQPKKIDQTPISSRAGFNALTDRNNVKNHH